MSKTPETLTTEESALLLESLVVKRTRYSQSWKPHRNYLIALLMLDAGLRVGEVCRLRISDLFFEDTPKKALQIDSVLAEKGCTRLIPLSVRTVQALERMWLDVWRLQDLNSDLFAFTNNSQSGPLAVRQVQRIIAAASCKAIGRKIHPHVLRHTFATRLMRVTSTPVIQRLLGHKNLSSTQVYTHPNGDDLRAAVDSI